MQACGVLAFSPEDCSDNGRMTAVIQLRTGGSRCQFCLSAKPSIHLPEAEACSAAVVGALEGTGL